MSKKDFKGGLDSLLGETKQDKPDPQGSIKKRMGRPKTSERVITKTSQEGTKVGEVRATFIVKEDLLDKVKGIAYWERIQIKDLVNSILQEYLNKYESKNGKIKDIPGKGSK